MYLIDWKTNLLTEIDKTTDLIRLIPNLEKRVSKK